MFKELKYVFYLLVIFLFVFFISKYYFSDQNKKNSYRSFKSIDQNVEKHLTNLPILKSDTDDIIDYVENNIDQNKKKYSFWELLTNDKK
tara:strand:- start:804 stop:1070 length:267 start_codon:yes stop_codon:yes gene_type:complete